MLVPPISMEQAKELKGQGNNLYTQKKFIEALQCYTEAAALQPQDPVLHSNISAVQYEIGNYAESIRTIDTALSLLTPPPNPQLLPRLLLRKAKSLFFSKQFEDCKKTLEQLTRECESAGIANLDTDGALAKALLTQSTPEYAQFSICRATCDTRTPEFYIVGHDRPASAFSGPITLEQHDILRGQETRVKYNKLFHQFHLQAPLRIHFNTPQQSFAFLFGGIGDARHLFASLAEIGELCPHPTTKRFHFTLVDIKETVLARDLVMFYIFKHLSKYPEEQMNNIEAIELLALAHFTYISVVIPGYLYEKLEEIIKEIISDLENKTLPPWISVSDQSIPGVLVYLHDWRDSKLPAGMMLSKFQGPIHADFSDIIQDRKSGNISLPKEFDDLPEDPSAAVKEQMLKMTDAELMAFPIPGKTAEEKRKALTEYFASEDSKSVPLDTLPGTNGESSSYEYLRVPYPPQALMDRHPEIKAVQEREQRLIRKLKKNFKDEEEGEEADTKKEVEEETKKEEEGEEEEEESKAHAGMLFKSAQAHIVKTFKGNPTFWDKWWVETIGESSFEFMLGAFDAISNICGTMYPYPSRPTCLYDYISILFSKVAIAIAKFGEKNIMLEWVAGDVYKTCLEISNTAEERVAKQFAVSYDRIYLSNIPDYVGGNLPIAIFCAPIMKPMPHAFIGYNILLNTAVFKNYEECVRTYTLLPQISDHQRYLGMKHIHGDLWGEDPNWSVLDCPLPPDQIVGQEELANWLHRIFLYIVLPPARPALVKFRVDHPLNLLAFVTLLNRLVALGYPRHWLATVLDNLLSGKLKTKARPPPNSTNMYIYPVATISTTPFLMELEYAIAACASHLSFPIQTVLPPLRLISVEKNLVVDPRDDQRACVVALLFGPRGAFKPAAAPKELTTLRDTIVNGDPKIALVSSMLWKSQVDPSADSEISKSSKIEFYASHERVEQMVRDDWYFAIVRVDSYRVLMHPVSIKSVI